MLRHAFVLSVASGAALIANTLAGAANSPYFAPEPPSIAGAPFSALVTTQSTTLFADGNRIVRTNTVHYFRDGQGRTRTERGVRSSDSSGVDTSIVTINDPVGAQRLTLYPRLKLALIRPMNAGVASSEISDATDDFSAPFALLGFGMGIGARPVTEASVAETSLGSQEIEGISTMGTRTVRTIPAGVLGNESPITSTLEKWVSPELGVPVRITQKSSIGGELTLTLGQIERAEPDPALFTVPADYRRREIRFPVPAADATSVTVPASDP